MAVLLAGFEAMFHVIAAGFVGGAWGWAVVSVYGIIMIWLIGEFILGLAGKEDRLRFVRANVSCVAAATCALQAAGSWALDRSLDESDGISWLVVYKLASFALLVWVAARSWMTLSAARSSAARYDAG